MIDFLIFATGFGAGSVVTLILKNVGIVRISSRSIHDILGVKAIR